MTQRAIEIRGLRKIFRVGMGGRKVVEALRGVDLTVQAGEIYGFLGPNGAGKSTTIKILTGLVQPTAGTAWAFGQPLATPAARQRVGYLPETPVFYDYLTGTEFLLYNASLVGLGRADAREKARALLQRVGLSTAGDLQLRRYSKGMIQRIGIAQALLQDPDLVILDEPVSGMDPVGRREIRDLMLELRSRGKTVFFSTHIIQDVELVCDRVGIIIAGKVVREGTVSELLSRDRSGTELVLGALQPDRVRELFSGLEVRDMGSGVSVAIPADRSVEDAVRSALAAGARLLSIQSRRRALEDLVMEEIAASRTDEGPRAQVVGRA